MQYWLMKSEPDTFGIDDLERVKEEPWDGIRNYQVRNMIRDTMKSGDKALFYHSNCKVPGVVGMMEIITEGYPDDTAWINPEAKYFDPKSTPENPRWYRVDVRFIKKLSRTISLQELREYTETELAELPLLRKGSRLSVMPVTEQQFDFILSLE